MAGTEIQRLTYYRELATLASRLQVPPESASTAALNAFRSGIMLDPDHLRRKLLGANSLRLRRLSASQRDALNVLGQSTDLLGPLAERRYEPSHTQVLAYLMAPRRGFPLATKLLESFLGFVGVDEFQLGKLRLSHALVQPECFILTGRVDISIHVPADAGRGLLVFVETKIDATEGDRQIERYRGELDRKAQTRIPVLAYLTLDDQPKLPAELGAIEVDFRGLLLRWLPVVASRGHDWQCSYAAAYLKTIAILSGAAADGSFDDWNFARQRAALELVEELRGD